MKYQKILLALWAISMLTSLHTVCAINQPARELSVAPNEVPLLSPKQLSKQMKDFKRYLNRVNRCLFTGPCTSEEIAQVRRHAWGLIKSLVIVSGAAVLYKYREPIKEWGQARGKEFKEAVKTTAKETVKASVEDIQVKPTYSSFGLPTGVEVVVKEEGREEKGKEEKKAVSRAVSPEGSDDEEGEEGEGSFMEFGF